MRYKVLWIDDDCNTTGRDFIGQAEQDDVDITAFESHEEGMDYLLNNLHEFHAVILDAKVKNKKSDTVIGIGGLKASRDRLIELNYSNDLPYFIFTGQPDYQTDEMFKESYGDFYVKGTDNERLIEDIINRINQKEDFILQKEYHKVFEVFTEKYLGIENRKELLKILFNIKKPNDLFEDGLYFTQLRIILELIFRSANKYGLLHDACIKEGKVNLTESSLFLAGEPTKHLNVYCKKKHFPKIIAEGVKRILFISGAASHTPDTEGENNLDLYAYRSVIKSPYLLYSLTYQLLDIIIWFHEYIKNNNDYLFNIGYWAEINRSDIVNGIITRIDATNGFGTFQPENNAKTLSILPKYINANNLHEGQFIKVKIEEKNNKIHIVEILN